MLQFTDANPVRPTSSSEDFDLANLEALGLDAVDPKPADVAVLGLGYVGLPTALGLATAGSSVIGIDASTARLTAIQDARVDLLPSDLERLRAALGRAEFQLTSNPSALRNAHAVLICVPTPVDPHLTPDLRPLARACATVVEQAVRGQTIILTSTTYVGTTRDLLLGPLTARGWPSARTSSSPSAQSASTPATPRILSRACLASSEAPRGRAPAGRPTSSAASPRSCTRSARQRSRR